MTIQFEHPLTAGTVLVISAIQSPDYVAGVSGWIVKQDGTVEFNDGTFRGTITAAEIIGSIFGTSSGFPAIWINQDDGNTIRVYNESGDLVTEIGADQGETGGAAFIDGDHATYINGNLIQWLYASGNVLTPASELHMNADGTALTWGFFFGGGVALHIPSGSWVSLEDWSSDTLQSWQTPALNAGWALGSSASANYQQFRYTKTPLNELWLYGAAKATAAAPTNTLFTLDLPYRPSPTGGSGAATIFDAGSLTQVTSADAVKATGRLNVQSNGAVVIGGFSVASGDTFYFNHRIPLGDVP